MILLFNKTFIAFSFKNTVEIFFQVWKVILPILFKKSQKVLYINVKKIVKRIYLEMHIWKLDNFSKRSDNLFKISSILITFLKDWTIFSNNSMKNLPIFYKKSSSCLGFQFIINHFSTWFSCSNFCQQVKASKSCNFLNIPLH